MDAIKNILGRFFRSGDWEKKTRQYALHTQWEKIVGPSIARQTEPAEWRQQTLCVLVSNSVWLQELRMLEEDILEKIREACPDLVIEKIHWRLRSK